VELKLSCVCCGGMEFKEKQLDVINIEGHSYLMREESKEKIICENCGLEDYIDNLIITFR
jgi:predicted nucleic-acid-binding Zn-ribbon protein